ncbi:L-aspartate oxidase [Rhodococcus sp. G-MC3]|uniref:L-aspartate oxidase n=1 Tax=Rhodococcus sp. G-MC3 TaxID=3046209 RepID=UPI0024BB7287|nr:L-aspartate oxidase [Rhodococcus sp. G-MC3]MDJ0393129.1 L-aspartate oxidase [Rhodococcus sp. G-MC3]
MTIPSGVSVAWEASADLVVVGGGVAGLSAAAAARRGGLRVLTVSKGGPLDTATQYAQGGIAVPGTRDGDSVDAHVFDTCEAGGGLCVPSAVRSIVSGGLGTAATLQSLGASFDRDRGGDLARTREGGHSVRRIIHAGGDATGAEVQRALNISVGAVSVGAEAGHSVLFGSAAARVLVHRGEVVGLLVSSDQGFGVVHSPVVLLATGGLGQLYSCSTNPPGATADGIALGLDAGAEIADLEFVQFHPTVLFAAGSSGRRPLVSEAVRGEGAHLVDQDGLRIMTGVHPLGDLAPRDVVSRAIAERLHITGTDHVLLDARSIDKFHSRFPTVTAACLAAGIDPREHLIPVAPAAHYSCGGIVTDVWGRTGVPGLLAAGEVARTGLHGANRLASNSLLEGLVVGERAGAVAAERLGVRNRTGDVQLPAGTSVPRERLQQLMTEHAGVVRDGYGLDRVASAIRDEASVSGREVRALEDSALTITASALVRAAMQRRESRGCHTRRDFPSGDEDMRRSIRTRKNPDGDLESRFESASQTDAGSTQTMAGVNG